MPAELFLKINLQNIAQNNVSEVYMTLNRIIGKIAKRYVPNNVQMFLRYFYWKNIKKNQSKPRKVLQFEVHLTDHCNLNCAGCSHFSSIAPKYYLNCETFEMDCKRLYELTHGKIERIHLVGGEPLLHPELNKIMAIAGKYFNDGVIELITNGILLLKQPENFWEICKKNKITIIITKYPIKRDDEEIKKMTEKYKIDLEYWGGEIKTFHHIPLDINGKQDTEKSFRKCGTKNLCIQLREGKLYTCHTAAYIKIFNEYFGERLNTSENDFIDIYKARNIKKILKYLSKAIPFCRYCNIQETKSGIKWNISEKKITEWI
jgi:MoaA/NifB/PqqE/SkfB family radical SAM enzyme